MWGAEDGVRVKRKLLVFNDVFQPLTDSIQQHRLEHWNEPAAGERPVVFCVSGWDCELFMGSLTHWGDREEGWRGEQSVGRRRRLIQQSRCQSRTAFLRPPFQNSFSFFQPPSPFSPFPSPALPYPIPSTDLRDNFNFFLPQPLNQI